MTLGKKVQAKAIYKNQCSHFWVSSKPKYIGPCFPNVNGLLHHYTVDTTAEDETSEINLFCTKYPHIVITGVWYVRGNICEFVTQWLMQSLYEMHVCASCHLTELRRHYQSLTDLHLVILPRLSPVVCYCLNNHIRSHDLQKSYSETFFF